MKKFVMKFVLTACVATLAMGLAAAQTSDLFPPNAKPGECYARVFVPPKYDTSTEQVLAREASQRIEVIPGKTEWGTEKILVKDATTKLVVVPAKYQTVTEKVLDRPAHTVWKKGTNPLQSVGASAGGGSGAKGASGTGEIMCLVEVPAKYKTVTKRVLATPATTKTVEIPAEYTTVKVQRQVKAPTTRTIDIPAEYKTITKRTMVADGKLEWQPVLCETNANVSTITAIQRALKTAGYNPGPIDGRIGFQTLQAVRDFQRAKGLPTGGLTMDTIRALGVNPR